MKRWEVPIFLFYEKKKKIKKDKNDQLGISLVGMGKRKEKKLYIFFLKREGNDKRESSWSHGIMLKVVKGQYKRWNSQPLCERTQDL